MEPLRTQISKVFVTDREKKCCNNEVKCNKVQWLNLVSKEKMKASDMI